jgi:hypothetical protein
VFKTHPFKAHEFKAYVFKAYVFKAWNGGDADAMLWSTAAHGAARSTLRASFMNNGTARLLVLAIVLFTGSLGLAQFGRRGGDPELSEHGWLTSLAAGKEQARRSGKPLMVVLRCVP